MFNDKMFNVTISNLTMFNDKIVKVTLFNDARFNITRFNDSGFNVTIFDVTIFNTRSLGALRAPTSSWRPFGPLDFVLRALRALRPCEPRVGDQIGC